MNKVSIIRRPTRDPQEEAAEQAKALAGMEVIVDGVVEHPATIALCEHDVPKIRGEHSVKLKAMPEDGWSLLPVGALK